jgi:hypothetical protein
VLRRQRDRSVTRAAQQKLAKAGFKVSRFQGFRVSRFQSFKVSELGIIAPLDRDGHEDFVIETLKP